MKVIVCRIRSKSAMAAPVMIEGRGHLQGSLARQVEDESHARFSASFNLRLCADLSRAVALHLHHRITSTWHQPSGQSFLVAGVAALGGLVLLASQACGRRLCCATPQLVWS
jgi:hypothetical protein